MKSVTTDDRIRRIERRLRLLGADDPRRSVLFALLADLRLRRANGGRH